MRDLPPVHPGEHLREDFMRPRYLSAYRVAQDLRVPTTRIQALITGRRGITADTALRLARYFGTTPEFWMNLQRDYELEKAKIEHGFRIEVQVSPCARGAAV
jgi:addiction module HigA family antidote